MNDNLPAVYREEQYYRDNPPFLLLAAVAAILGWALLIWNGLLARPIGLVELPSWLAIGLGLLLGVGLPVLFWRLKMVTTVQPDKITVNTGAAGTLNFPFAEITAIEGRVDDIRGDYSNRNVGRENNTRVAYVVNSQQGLQLTLADGRLILIGSQEVEQLTEAALGAWQNYLAE